MRSLKSAGFKFQRDGRTGQRPFLEAGGNLLSLTPENSFERTEIGDVALERRLGGDALGFAIGSWWTAGEPATLLPPKSGTNDAAKVQSVGKGVQRGFDFAPNSPIGGQTAYRVAWAIIIGITLA